MARGEFNQAGPARMMAESTCGIFGLGGTGLALARLLKGMGAAVHEINRRGESSVPIDWVGRPDALDTMLAVSDIVFVTAPLSRETVSVIGARELGLMKEDAILVNLAPLSGAPLMEPLASKVALVRSRRRSESAALP